MDTEKQKHFIIHFLYYTLIAIVCYVFLKTIIYMLMPFILGFAIAFLLHPLIRLLSKNGHERLWSMLVIFVFYALLGLLLTWLVLQGFFYARKWMYDLPSLYQTYIQPYLHTSTSSIQSVWKNIDINTAELFSMACTSLQRSLSSFLTTISKSMLTMLTNLMSSIPSILLSFFFTILSSFFINADYHKIQSAITTYLPFHLQQEWFQLVHFLKTTFKQLFSAYAKLMLLTFLELFIGLYLLGLKQVFWIALGIALFDIIPVLGCGGILLPWALISYLNQQSKFAVGLVILYLLITIIRNIIEPRIVGHQIGLHPLIMLLCMYIGGRVFGVLGIFTLPLLLLILKNRWLLAKKKNTSLL